MRAEFYGCVLSGKRTVNGHYLRGGGKRDRKERGVGSRWLCDHQIYLISPSPRLYNIVMILSRWQSIFCNPPSLCWRRMIPPSYSLKTTRSPQITPRPSSLRWLIILINDKINNEEFFHGTWLSSTILDSTLIYLHIFLIPWNKSQTVIKYLVGMSTWMTFKSIFVQKEKYFVSTTQQITQ